MSCLRKDERPWPKPIYLTKLLEAMRHNSLGLQRVRTLQSRTPRQWQGSLFDFMGPPTF